MKKIKRAAIITNPLQKIINKQSTKLTWNIKSRLFLLSMILLVSYTYIVSGLFKIIKNFFLRSVKPRLLMEHLQQSDKKLFLIKTNTI